MSRAVTTIILLIAGLLLMLAAWLLRTSPDEAEQPTQAKIWRDPAHPLEDDHCARNACQPEAIISLGRSPMVLMVDPAIDDAVAQWGDCINQFQACVDGLEQPTAASIQACMARATACPPPCRDEYRRRSAAATSTAEALAAFAKVFLNDDAPCLPR